MICEIQKSNVKFTLELSQTELTQLLLTLERGNDANVLHDDSQARRFTSELIRTLSCLL